MRKKQIRTSIHISKDHLHKLHSMGLNNISEAIRRCIDKAEITGSKQA